MLNRSLPPALKISKLGILGSTLARAVPVPCRILTRTMASQNIGGVEASMRSKLSASLNPTLLEINNDSQKHAHHAPMKAIGGGSGETHFSLVMVSPEFTGLSSIKRHRVVNNLLKEEFDAGLHALSLKLKTPEEWEKEKSSTSA